MALPDAVTTGLINIGNTPATGEALRNAVGAADDGIADATFVSISADVADVVTVTIQLLKEDGTDIDERQAVLLVLFDEATADNIYSSTDVWGAGTDGTVVEIGTGVGLGVCEADGDLDVAITHAGADIAFLAVVTAGGKLIISTQLTWDA